MTPGFDPRRFASLAAGLVREPGFPADARCRTAVGRAYYALFLAVRAKYETAGVLTREARIGHGELRARLLGAAAAPAREVGLTLGALYEARRVADYQRAPSPVWRNVVERPSGAGTLIRRAEAALRLLEGIEPRDLR